MATRGTQILNPRTGQRSVYLQTAHGMGGALFQMESHHPPHGLWEPEHTHPFQESRSEILQGKLRFRVGGTERIVSAGESVVIPAGVPHTFVNDDDAVAHAIQEFRPALNIEDFFVAYVALARDGKLNQSGMPRSMLQLAVLMKAYDQVMRVTDPPRFLQWLLMESLGPLGRLAGYRPDYI